MQSQWVLEKTRSPRGLGKVFPRAMEIGNYAVGDHWHKWIAKEHFTAKGENKYGYEPRGKGYTIRKAKKKGHRNPLVWSGRWMANVLRSAVIIARPGSVKVKMSGRHWRGKAGGNYPDLDAELTRVVSSEAEQLARLHKWKVAEALNKIKAND